MDGTPVAYRDMKFQKRVAIVTGAGRRDGIGEAIACHLSREGAKVALVDLCRERPDVPREQFGQWQELLAVAEHVSAQGGFALPLRCDVTDEAEVAAMVEQVRSHFGGIDLLFNNAGGGTGAGPVDRTPVTDLSRQDWDYTLSASLTATFLCSKHAASHIRDGGAIVNTISVSAHRGMPGGSAYAAAKFALVNFTQTLALELAPRNIRVNGLSPGMTMTQYVRQRLEAVAASQPGKSVEDVLFEWLRNVPLARAADPDEIASVATFLASSDASYMTGQTLIVDGGLTLR
jgi:NAD(P)-dependent dehydrogenase (short-subunit alcohol dehydrogenase family)